MSDRFLITSCDEKVLATAIKFADAHRPYHIFGKLVLNAANRLRSHGFVEIASAPTKTEGSRLSYFDVTPTASGRAFWRRHLLEPARKGRGGVNRSIPIDDIRATENALVRAGTVPGAAAVLGMKPSIVRYRMLKLNATGRLIELGLKMPDPNKRGGSVWLVEPEPVNAPRRLRFLKRCALMI